MFVDRPDQSASSGAWFAIPNQSVVFEDLKRIGESQVNDRVELFLDASLNFNLESELVINGDFSSGSSGWNTSPESTISVENNIATITNTSAGYGFLERSVTGLTTGKFYLFSADIKMLSSVSADALGCGQNLNYFSGGSWDLLLGAITSPSEWVTYTGIFLATDSDCEVGMRNYKVGSGDNYQIKNVSIKETLGYNAIQATDSLAPLLKQNSNNNYYLSFDQVDDLLTATLPDLGSSATTIEGNSSAVAIAESQTISGTTNLPTPVELYGMIYVDRSLSDIEKGMITNYMKMNGAG